MKIRLLISILIYLLALNLHADPTFVHCYDFGCKHHQEIQFSQVQWQQISSLFSPGLDQPAEKQALRKAIALMERFGGKLVGTSLDKGGNYAGYDLPKQMDCIDESTNTFQYLSAIESLGLLKWHTVGLKKRRIVWFISHWTAVIAENSTNQKFAVDSWYRDNGEPPYIQPLADWQVEKDFPRQYNPD